MTNLAALSAAATAAPWTMESEGERVVISGEEFVVLCSDGLIMKMPSDEDAALIVALRNAYANGDLIEREKVEALVAENAAWKRAAERTDLAWMELIKERDRLRAALDTMGGKRA